MYATDEEWLEKAGNHSEKIAEKYNTNLFGKAVSGIYREEIIKGGVEEYESIALCEKSAGRI